MACGGYVTDFTAGSAALRNMILLASGVAALLLAALLYAFITRQLRPVRKIVQALERIGAGDLQARIGRGNDTGPTRNELDIIARSIDASTASMGQLIGELRQQSREVEGTAAALSQVSRALADNAATQSNAASAMAAGVEELAVSINILSDNARSTDSSVRETRELASQGREASGAAVSQMANIEQAVADAAGQIEHLGEASRQISSVVSVIREVADQTNLLALNAAIEAARAGEQGRGFAVVADEVRKLSERTAVSTGEIGKMVDAIQVSTREVVAQVGRGVTMVDEGVANARQAGDTIGGLQEMAKKVSQLVADVDEALREQASASNDVAKKVEDVAAQAEESTAIARQTSGAANTMTQTAHAMEQLVARFRI